MNNITIHRSKSIDTDNISDLYICIVGLGYVGLPLFCLLASKHKCCGYDNDNGRICSLMRGDDSKKCVSNAALKEALSKSVVTSNLEDIAQCRIYIVTVPTPVDKNGKPNTSALCDACANISHFLKKGDIVVFESTVFPGATEELCIPILEENSNLRLGDFKVGYSPERINFGDSIHQLHNTPKVISASDKKTLDFLFDLYSSIIDEDIIKASSIKVAEASKMYENVQRDVLIGLANEYSEFCKTIGINIYEVTQCSSSKWNFATVFPGLVGGHCISVDPYYLLQKASDVGISLPLVSQARKVNEAKASNVASCFVKQVQKLNTTDSRHKILILGFSYKKNSSDIRNTKVVKLVQEIERYGFHVDVYDPLVDKVIVEKYYGIHMLSENEICYANYEAIIEVVHHDIFLELKPDNDGATNVFNIEQFL